MQFQLFATAGLVAAIAGIVSANGMAIVSRIFVPDSGRYVLHTARLHNPANADPPQNKITVDVHARKVALGIFDGCPQTVTFVASNLPGLLLRSSPVDAQNVFADLDRTLVNKFVENKKWPANVLRKNGAADMEAVGGCSASVAIIDVTGNVRLHYAGDTVAVLYDAGRNGGVFRTRAHSTSSAAERERLRFLHPQEGGTLFTNNLLLGDLRTTRGFGHAEYKLPARCRDTTMTRNRYISPPYITANAETFQRNFKIDSHPNNLLIVGTNAVFEHISENELLNLLNETPTHGCNRAEYVLRSLETRGVVLTEQFSVAVFIPSQTAAQ